MVTRAVTLPASVLLVAVLIGQCGCGDRPAPAVPISKVTPPPATLGPVDLTKTSPWDYPGFRGLDRSGIVREHKLSSDWVHAQPKLLWRREVGLGWSSFSVVGDFCLTQEQHGPYETVVCYELRTGREVWVHRDRTLFENPTGGNGPRATPTIDGGRVYTLGATGVLNCLDGSTGEAIWSKDILGDNEAENVYYGLSGSPLVTERLVVVAPGGRGHSVVAYDKQTGEKVWAAGDDPASYASPQLATLAGRRQVLNFNAEGLAAHDLESGEILWRYPWVANPTERNNVCQPVPLPPAGAGQADRVFISSGYGKGCALLAVTEADEEFAVETLWSNRNLKAKFTSVVVRNGFVFGLDERILACVDLETGRRRWKGGRYSYGQVMLVDDVLVVQAETGEVAFVEASPEGFRELARFDALDGRTWNHPVLAGSLLLVRNDQEAACYELAAADR